MKQLLLFLYFLSLAGMNYAQNILSLKECYELAEQNYPLIDQRALYNEYESIQERRLNKNHLPKVDLNARATYQSETTELPIELPAQSPIQLNIPSLPKDSYKATLDMTQLIYDGSSTKSQKQLEIQQHPNYKFFIGSFFE